MKNEKVVFEKKMFSVTIMCLHSYINAVNSESPLGTCLLLLKRTGLGVYIPKSKAMHSFGKVETLLLKTVMDTFMY